MNCLRNWTLVLASVTLFSLSGCDMMFKKQAGRSLEQATKKYGAGDYKAAIGLYEAALDGTSKTSDIHYRLGLIYDDKLKEPLGALHHFQRYLELDPTGSHAKEVRSFIKAAHVKLSAKQGALVTQEDSARLKNENLALREQNVRLQAKSKISPEEAKAQPGKPAFPGAKSYIVKQGDTLASISRKVYKSSDRWKDIQDANFNTLEGKSTLKPGQTLIIP